MKFWNSFPSINKNSSLFATSSLYPCKAKFLSERTYTNKLPMIWSRYWPPWIPIWAWEACLWAMLIPWSISTFLLPYSTSADSAALNSETTWTAGSTPWLMKLWYWVFSANAGWSLAAWTIWPILISPWWKRSQFNWKNNKKHKNLRNNKIRIKTKRRNKSLNLKRRRWKNLKWWKFYLKSKRILWIVYLKLNSVCMILKHLL